METFEQYDTRLYREEQKQPRCCKCDKPIWDDYLWDFFDALYCDDCAQATYRQPTDNYRRET